MRLRLLLILLLALVPLGCGSVGDGPVETTAAGRPSASGPQQLEGTVTVLAASSLTETFETLARRFEQRHPGVHVRLTFAASSTLRQQIRSGAGGDVFAAASPEAMVGVGTARGPLVFARNRLQIAVPPGNPGKVTGLADFADPQRTFAVCAAQVPCGAAAQKAFELAGVDAKPDTFGNNVKTVLTSVRLGEVDAGLVYRTDVLAAAADVDGVDFPEAERVESDYVVALLAESGNSAAAKRFVDDVSSADARNVLAKAGFELP